MCMTKLICQIRPFLDKLIFSVYELKYFVLFPKFFAPLHFLLGLPCYRLTTGIFLTCHRQEIYREEVVGLKNFKYRPFKKIRFL